VYCGSSKKVLTALLTLADCVGSLNTFESTPLSDFRIISHYSTIFYLKNSVMRG